MTRHEHSQEEILQFQTLVEQYHEMQEQVQGLAQHKEELERVSESLKIISQCKEGDESLLPLGGGIYLKGSLKNNAEVLMNVGAQVVVTKPLDEAQKSVEEQVQEVVTIQSHLEEESQKLLNYLKELQAHLKENNITN